MLSEIRDMLGDFGQEIEGRSREFFNYRGVYVELLHNGTSNATWLPFFSDAACWRAAITFFG